VERVGGICVAIMDWRVMDVVRWLLLENATLQLVKVQGWTPRG
jgi:hypothetical protein